MKSTKASDLGGNWLAISPKEINESNKNLEFRVGIFGLRDHGVESVKYEFESNSEAKKMTINGVQAFYKKDVMLPDQYSLQSSAKSEDYLFSNKDISLYVFFDWERHQNIGSPSNFLNYSYQDNLPSFTDFVNSIKFSN